MVAAVYVIPDNVVGIVVELRDGSTTNPGSILGNGKRFFCTQKLQDRLWDPTWGFFLCGKVTGT
jgi:hypothetical protein